MIPDKIYFGYESECRLEPFTKRIRNSDIEYIRKDSLLEWAKEKQYESLTIVADNFWQEVIDKIQSL